MRALFATYPGPSHYFPIVSLGWALRAAGHEVLVATQPGFTATVTASGLPAAAVGADVDMGARFRERFAGRLDQTFKLPPEWPATLEGLRDAGLLPGVTIGLEHFVEHAELVAGDMVELARAWRPDAVVCEPTAFFGAVAARVCGVPAVRHLWGPDFFHWLGGTDVPALRALADRFGVEDVPVTGDIVLDPCPDDMQAPATRGGRPMGCVPYNGPGVRPDWLNPPAGRPRVCVTWGTWITGMGLNHLFRVGDVLDTFAAFDAEFVVTAGEPERARIGAVPGNVRLIDPLPLHLLLPGCDAIVHQGGTGTIMTAAAYGVPQLALPQIPDQLFNAGRLAVTGAGRYLPPGEPSPEALSGGLLALLDDPAARTAAGGLRERIRSRPAPSTVAAGLAAELTGAAAGV